MQLAEAQMAEHTFAGLTCSDLAELAPAFVLGALNAGEADAVRRHLAGSCHAAYESASETRPRDLFAARYLPGSRRFEGVECQMRFRLVVEPSRGADPGIERSPVCRPSLVKP